MFIVFVFVIFLVNFSMCNDVFNSGRDKFEQIRSLSSSKTSPCWTKILTMLNEHCSIDQLEKYQSFIAYEFTLCHLSTMNEDFDSFPKCNEENVDQCVEQLHRHMNAFIGDFSSFFVFLNSISFSFTAFTEFYPFVQSVCYVLREKSYQSELSTRLTLFLNHSKETIEKLVSSIEIQQKLTHQIHHQQSVQETILNNARQLKSLARMNMDKTQDILSSVIEAARHEYDLLKQVNNKMKFFNIFFSYLLDLCFVSNNSNGRSNHLYLFILVLCFVDVRHLFDHNSKTNESSEVLTKIFNDFFTRKVCI